MLTDCADRDIMDGMGKRRIVDLAETLRTAFEKSGMNRHELSRRTGIAYSVIHRFMAGDKDLNLRTASKIADALGLELRPKRR